MTTLAGTQTYARRVDGLAIGALIVGSIGALFGLGAFLAVVVGDDMIPLEIPAYAGVALAVVGLVAAIFARDYTLYGAIGMAAAPIGYVLAFGGSWGAWWSKYQDAIATSGAAENAFWSSMPAMALFAVSGALLVIGALLAGFSALSSNEEA